MSAVPDKPLAVTAEEIASLIAIRDELVTLSKPDSALNMDQRSRQAVLLEQLDALSRTLLLRALPELIATRKERDEARVTVTVGLACLDDAGQMRHKDLMHAADTLKRPSFKRTRL